MIFNEAEGKNDKLGKDIPINISASFTGSKILLDFNALRTHRSALCAQIQIFLVLKADSSNFPTNEIQLFNQNLPF